MLMEELFSRRILVMGPSRADPGRQVGVFHAELLRELPALRATEMQKYRWIAGQWASSNKVPATRVSSAYTDVSTSTFQYCEKDQWICLVGPDGRERPHITFDPFSRQWMYVLAEGAYGILRSSGWEGHQIVFTGEMTMIGVTCYWRQTCTKASDDEFRLVNEERLADGSWSFVDEWEFQRK